MKILRTFSYGQYIVGDAKERPQYNHAIAGQVSEWMLQDEYYEAYSHLQILPLFMTWHGIEENEPFQIDSLDVSTQAQRISVAVQNEMHYWSKCVFGLYRRNNNLDWTLPVCDRRRDLTFADKK